MTPKSDESGKSATLPAPELNPLLNPILNKHLGRWAEVYFTNPPEKRDQAVLRLLRELEDAGAEAPAVSLFQARSKLRSTVITAPEGRGVTCGECGFENDSRQRFCGDCGAPLAAVVAGISDNPKSSEHEPPATERATFDLAPQFGSILHLSDPLPESRRHEASTSRLEVEDNAGEPSPEQEAGSEPLGLSHRILIGAALAVIIGGLAYMVWRGGQAAPGRSMFPQQAPTATTNQASPAQPAVQIPSSPQSAPAPVPAVESNARPQNAAQPPSPESKRSATPGSSEIPSANGSQELAQALDLLNGVGRERDSTQASVWLWKAVEKRNTHATVLLAGLYLRGDGVQKNCDQGRILLDAAAIKGSKDAAALLQNLQAFGCQ